MHQVVDVYGPLNVTDIGAKSQQDLWFNYSTVTRLFRDKVVEVFHQEDLVWIHGFHLMLLPSFLRRILLQAKIGIFFHTPFPSSEIWRTMARREDLLRGILSADHIGFHLYEYARHFRSVCHRLLAYNSEMSATGSLNVYVDGRAVAITCMHVGVDLPRLQASLSSDNFEVEVTYWKNKFPHRIIIAGMIFYFYFITDYVT
jgi:trehalose 6-phosphate synthase/phosphatase